MAYFSGANASDHFAVEQVTRLRRNRCFLKTDKLGLLLDSTSMDLTILQCSEVLYANENALRRSSVHETLRRRVRRRLRDISHNPIKGIY